MRPRVMFVGDSITAGFGSGVSLVGWRDEFWRELTSRFGTTPINVGGDTDGQMGPNRLCGASGQRTDELLVRGRVQVPQFRPHLVTIHAGTNDATQRVTGGQGAPTRAQSVANVRSFLDLLQYANDSVLVLLATSLVPNTDAAKDAEILAYGNDLHTMAATHPLYLAGRLVRVDFRSAFLADAQWGTKYMSDETHPNSSGYAVMATVWKAALASKVVYV